MDSPITDTHREWHAGVEEPFRPSLDFVFRFNAFARRYASRAPEGGEMCNGPGL